LHISVQEYGYDKVI
nr:immunoglobulin heavy chain junction region [Mus musculus]